MKYVDAGYAIALVVLALYAGALALRRRRLERAVPGSAAPSRSAQGPAAGAPGRPGAGDGS